MPSPRVWKLKSREKIFFDHSQSKNACFDHSSQFYDIFSRITLVSTLKIQILKNCWATLVEIFLHHENFNEIPQIILFTAQI